MKAFFSAIGGFLDMLPGWAWAGIVAALVLHSCGQGVKLEAGQLKLSQQETKTTTAEKQLSDRVAAEASVVTVAVLVARQQEQAKFQLQQEKTDALRKQNAAARAELAAAGDRVRSAIDSAAAGSGCPNVPQGTATAAGTENDAGAEFKRAGGKLADGILQLLATGDEAIRERNLCVDLRPLG